MTCSGVIGGHLVLEIRFLSLSLFCRFFVILALAGCGVRAYAVQCAVVHSHPPSPAEQAYLKGDFEHAVTLYQEDIQSRPNDSELILGLVHALLKQQKVQDAADVVQKALAQNSKAIPVLAAEAEVQYRAGTPWLAAATTSAALKMDLCNPELHLVEAKILRLNSYYASAAKELGFAHALEPDNPDVRLQWLATLPLTERISQLEAYLATPTGDDAEELKHLRLYLDFLKKESEQPHKACRLVSDTASTTIPFDLLMRDPTHIEAYGLNVKLNDHNARLAIDTGAGGIIISRSVANRAGLQRFSQSVAAGIGNRGEQSAYTAYADSIKIGSLEFRDCNVEVLDQRSVVDSDGLIGMDVFSRFLVTLDYPMRKLILGPLPPRPGETTANKPALETANAPDEDAGDGSASASSGPSGQAAPRGPHDPYIAPEMKEWIPVFRVGHTLMLPASLNKSATKLFILDTGAFSTTITPAVAREVTKVHSDNFTTVKGISGKVDNVYRADEITFIFAHLSQKVSGVVTFDTPNLSKDIGMDIAGLIGITALGQTTMKIDYRDGLVNFTYDPNRGYRASALIGP